MATLPSGSIRHSLDLDPAELIRRIGGWDRPALLVSGRGFGEAGRWSILAARPRATLEAVGGRWVETLPDGRIVTHSGSALAGLTSTLERYGLNELASDELDPDFPPFLGGLIGLLGYDLAPQLERLPRRAPRTSRIPDVRFALHDTAVVVDHQTATADLWVHDLLGEGKSALQTRAEMWLRDLRVAGHAAPPRTRVGPVVSNFSQPEYVAAVRRALEYIAAGDIFQVNLSQRFVASGEVVPLDLFLRLSERSPAPFSAFLQWDDLAVVSASPEWFYQTWGDRIVTRPIKGTRPRGASAKEDARLAAELQASAKDRAELTMIVDLERNDLGRVSRYGSVKVTDALTVESFAQVHHLVATIEGRLWPHVGPADVVRAVFPGGSITGAPKIRAMEIIDELEPTRRSLYTGAIGYFSRGGRSAFNIVIRTMLVEGNHVSYQVGGGIVADSDPLAEYHETLHKGRGLRAVLDESVE